MFNAKKALIPYPQKVDEKGGEKLIAITSIPYFKLVIGEGNEVFEEAVSLLRNAFCDKAAILGDSTEQTAYPIYIKVDPNDEKFAKIGKADAYYIDINEDKAVLCGFDAGGAYYAAVTFLQLLHTENEGLFIPYIFICDYPSFSHRGLFMECRYGSDFMTFEDWKNGIDYLAAMKYNQITVGIYGCWNIQYDNMISEYLYIPFKKYPQLQTPRNIKYYSVAERKWIYKKDVLPTMFQDDYLGELIAYGKRKNIKVKPLFNSLGHNTLLPRMFPEVSAKDEDGKDTGFGFCTASDETYKLMFELYDEIIERYLVPNGIDSIEIGLDEVNPSVGINPDNVQQLFSPFCQCEQCKNKDHTDMIIDYLIRVCKYLKSKGLKNIYIYHDMLFNNNNAINDTFVLKLNKADIYDVVVIDWWSYTKEEKLFSGRANEVNSICRSIIKPMTGYYHWTVPTETNDNIRVCARMARDLGFEGIEAYSSFEYCYDFNYLYQAELSWNIDMLDEVEDFHNRYSYKYYGEDCDRAVQAIDLVREIMRQEREPNYILQNFEYYWHSFMNSEKSYPINFPGTVYTNIFENKKLYIPYLQNAKRNTTTALNFFKEQEGCGTSPQWINKVWLLTALAYYTTAEEYLTLSALQSSYNNCMVSEYKLLSELERLISARECLMKLVENTRIRANQYMYLRNMSILRQYLLDLKNYVTKCISKGEKPKLDLTNIDYVKSEAYYFLR